VDCGRRGAPGKSLQLKVPARIEDVERLQGHGGFDEPNG
jgi:hypothetical protein